MPIFKNNSSKSYDIINVNDELQRSEPGSVIVTKIDYNLPDFDKVFDSYYHNPVVKITDVVLPLAQPHILNPLTKSFFITHITDNVTLALQEPTNYALKNWLASDLIITFEKHENPNRRMDQIYLTGSGTCMIMELDHEVV